MRYLTKLAAPLLLCVLAFSAVFRPPAEQRYAQTSGSGAILPGGSFLQPYGTQVDSGPGACGIAVSPKGTIATANAGPERFSVTVLERVKSSWTIGQFWARTPKFTLPEQADPNWKGVACGIAFENDRAAWVSEGESGKIRLLNIKSGNHEKIVDLNQAGMTNSMTGDLAGDPARHLLYALDDRNSRLAVIDTRKGQLLSSVPLNKPGIRNAALSENGSLVFVSGADGALGIIDVHQPATPSAVTWLGNGPGSQGAHGGILTVGDHIFVSNEADDSIVTYSTADRKVTATVPLRIPGLEPLRGIRPAGMAFDPLTKWLLVAETGINAVGIIDTEKQRLIGHIPTGLAPLRVAISGDRVFVTNSQGRGTGPNLRHPFAEFGLTPALHHGSISTFIVPTEAALSKLTGLVLADNGMAPLPAPPARLPEGIRYVVLIQKGDRSFDEVFGDIRWSSNPLSEKVQAVPQLARFGIHGQADGGKLKFSIKDVAITPNQHAIAERWAISDNFYATGQEISDPQLTAHLRNQPVQVFDEAGVPDQKRADQVIARISRQSETGEFPALTFVQLSGDRSGLDGDDLDHPYQASWVADNDYATGRILEALSHTPQWREMAVFIAEGSSDSGLDHIDSHRVALLAAGPWIRRDYISHTNSDSAGVLKTIFQLLKAPPMNLRDATARDLADLFTSEPNYSPYKAVRPDRRIFETR